MSLAARAPLLRSHILLTPRVGMQKRSMHVDNVVGDNMPFKYANKGAFGAKITVFLLAGFSLPFAASWYQLRKAGAEA